MRNGSENRYIERQGRGCIRVGLSDITMRFDKELPKRRRRKKVEAPAEEEPGELEESIESEKEAEAPVAEAPSEEKGKSKELYETDKGEAVLKYEKTPEKKGYCELRERTKAVYGIKYAAGRAVDMAKKAKAAILDWSFILPRKGDPERKKKEDLL